MFKVILDFDEKFFDDFLASKGYFHNGSFVNNPMRNTSVPYNMQPNIKNSSSFHSNEFTSTESFNVNANLINKVNDLESNLNLLSKNLLDLSSNLNNSNLLNEEKLVGIIDNAIEKKLSKDIITKDYFENRLEKFKEEFKEDISVSERFNDSELKSKLISEIKDEFLNSNVSVPDIDSLKNEILSSLRNDISEYKLVLEEEFKKKVNLLESENTKKFQDLMTNYQLQWNQLHMTMMNQVNQMMMNPMMTQVNPMNPSLSTQVLNPLENVENVVEKIEESVNKTAPSKSVGNKLSSMMNI